MGRLLSSRRFELAGVLLLSACALVVSARAGDQHRQRSLLCQRHKIYHQG